MNIYIRAVKQRFNIILNLILPIFIKDILAKRYWTKFEEIYLPKSAPNIYNLAIGKIKNINSILEFGCNNGVNLEYFMKRNKKLSTVGIDINPIAKELEKKFRQYKGYVSDENILEKFDVNQFSLSFTSSVLDHIPDEKNVKNILMNLSHISKFVILNEPFLDGVVGDVSDKYRYQVKSGLVDRRKSFAKYSYFWNYDKYLEELSLNYEKIHNPLYSFSMGPYYYLYIINTKNFKNSR